MTTTQAVVLLADNYYDDLAKYFSIVNWDDIEGEIYNRKASQSDTMLWRWINDSFDWDKSYIESNNFWTDIIDDMFEKKISL